MFKMCLSEKNLVILFLMTFVLLSADALISEKVPILFPKFQNAKTYFKQRRHYAHSEFLNPHSVPKASIIGPDKNKTGQIIGRDGLQQLSVDYIELFERTMYLECAIYCFVLLYGLLHLPIWRTMINKLKKRKVEPELDTYNMATGLDKKDSTSLKQMAFGSSAAMMMCVEAEEFL